MTLDSNLVTAQWGLIGAFGVAVTLLAPRAEQYRSDYLQTGEIRDRIRANRWGNLVRRTPMMVLVAVGGLSVLGAQAAGSKWIRVPSETFVLLLVPILAQVGFVYLLIKLVPKLPSVMPGRLTAPLTPYPASRPSVAQTTITFANESNQSLLIWWLDTTGTPFPVDRDGKPNRIPPDRSESLNSYDGHFFLIQTLDGLNVGIAEARESPSIVSISQAALDTTLPVSRSVVPSPQRSLLGSAFQKITSILGGRNDHS